MSELEILGWILLVVIAAGLVALLWLAAVSVPELRRYVKVRSM